jgi:very-short-patch-repair endonuclease
MTEAEQRLWRALRCDALAVRFRRQHPIGPFVADFACFTRKLVVEVDGATHWSDAQRAHDAKRTAFLERAGWRVMRFTNEDVRLNLDGVLETIALALRDAPPPPALRATSPKGEET